MNTSEVMGVFLLFGELLLKYNMFYMSDSCV